MRWEALFNDLEAQLAAADAEELAAEVADRSRRELARLRVDDRVRAAIGATVTVAVTGAGTITGQLLRAGPQWWLLSGAGNREQLVVPSAVSWVAGLPALSAEPDSVGAVESALGLAYVLRGIARDRAPVSVLLRDGATLTGTLDRVGADFVDLAMHAAGEARRLSAVREARTVPFSALAVLRAG